MFFPWIGLFEQIRLPDVYVHYDDVQFPQGRSFISRVQIKTINGQQWLTAPVIRNSQSFIKDVHLDNSQPWRKKHLKTLRFNYTKAVYMEEMLKIVNEVYDFEPQYLSKLNIYAIEKITKYFGFKTKFVFSSDFNISGKGSDKLLGIISELDGEVYITGHGASNYIDHNLFELNGVKVEYMNYQKFSYPQLYGQFNPHVSILDLIANVGKKGIKYMKSQTINWRDFLNESN